MNSCPSNKLSPTTAAAQYNSWFFITRKLGTTFQIPLEVWVSVGAFLRYATLCRQKPCLGLIPHPRTLTKCLNGLIIS